MRPRKYKLVNGAPVVCESVEEWALWYESADEDRIVARTEVFGARVSTVFLGIDHNFNESGPPILYETIVIGSAFAGESKRYATVSEALAGHHAICDRVRERFS